MPVRIPTYQQQASIQGGTPAPDVPMAVPTSNVGQSITQAGQAVGTFADAQMLVQKDAAATEAARVTSQVGLQLNAAKNAALANAPTGGYGLSQGFQETFDKLRTDTLEGVTNPYAQKALNLYFDHQQTIYGTAMQDAENTMRTKYIASNVTDSADNVARTVAQDPSQYNASLAPLIGTINGLDGIDGNLKAALAKKVTQQAAVAAGTRVATDNPAGFMTAFQTPADKPLPAGFEWMRNIEADKLNILTNHAQTLLTQQQNAADREAQARETQATSAFNAAFDVISKGQNLSPQALSDLQTAAKGTSAEADAKSLVQVQAQGAQFGSQSLTQQASTLERMRAAAADPKIGVDPIESKVLTQYEQIHSAAVDAYKKNPWQAAQAYGVTQNAPVVPIQSVDDAIAVANSRAGAQGVVEQAAGRKVSPFQPAEAQQLANVLQALPVDQRASAISQLGRTMLDPSRAADFAKQIGDSHRPLYLQLMQGTINATTVGGYPVAQLIGQGEQAIRDKTAGVDDKVQEGARAQIAQAVRGTFASGVQDQDAVDSAYYIYAALSARDKIAPQSVDAAKVKLAVDAATGGLTTFNGKPTAKPYGWDDDRFNASVKAVTPASVQTPISDGNVHFGKTNIPVADFISKVPGAQLVRVTPNGGYAVVAGTGFATNSAGQPIILRLK
ncbi:MULTISPECIES: hypothetical protein [unclassified Caballeronia]|uniref:hypothetical protein n=1 Tax=unclassified Caballeronia TaxID=2646786 RepID=UPI001F1D10B5|nr:MULTISPECIES: hypothetical protein [unclassified Caballeronia]MCE4544592.1 hypothetical protein [Caballeronia sp. PC1]MCE4571744.1 hypothetical protein [Caballeronia sp. CLC5]